MRRSCLPLVLGATLAFRALTLAQDVIAPGHQPPGAPLPRYVYNVVAADFSMPAGNPLIKSKFSVYDPIDPGTPQFDANIAKMGELNVTTSRIEMGWGRNHPGAGAQPSVGGSADKLVFDFRSLDHVVQQLRTQDVQLLGSYCYTPVPLQDPNLEVQYGEGHLKLRVSTPTKDLGKWKEVITAFARHYREIGIPFSVHEVWNEPDGTYNFFSGTEAEYEQLYGAAVDSVRAVDPDAVVAGPGADHHLLWNATFIDFVASRHLPLDYYTFHEYGSGELAVRQVERAGSSLNRYPDYNTTALSLDEWHDGECCNWCNDDVRNHYEGAPELLHDFVLLLGRPELASVSWAWWQDPPGHGAGCMGLLTADGRRKAVFNAWKLYAMMPVDRREVRVEGELEALASCDEHKASLLIWNRSSYERRVDVHMNRLPFQKGTVRLYRIDNKHASPVDGADENLSILEAYPITSATGWSYLDGRIPKYGVVYFEASDGSGLSELAPVHVGNVIRVDRYYPVRGMTKSYADFDRKTWITCLGMMGESADQEMGVLADGLPDSLLVITKVEGNLQKVGATSLLAIRLDYRVEGKYVKAVWLHGPYSGLDLFDPSREITLPWGLKPQVDQVVAIPDFAAFKIPLKTYAPPGWTGTVHVSFVMRDAGPSARATILLRATD